VRWRQERAAAEPAQAPIDKRRRDVAAVGSEEEEEEHAPGPPLLVGAILLLPFSPSFGSRSKKEADRQRCRKMKNCRRPIIITFNTIRLQHSLPRALFVFRTSL
jgi:hypothetical protein